MLKKIIATLFTKGFIALINLAILLVSTKQLGSDGRGEISLLILNIAIIQAINEIYTGYALVYFVSKFSFKKIYRSGFLWTVVCTLILSLIFLVFHKAIKEQWIDVSFHIGDRKHWIHLTLLSFIIIMHSFHGVILLAKEKIRTYNFLNFFQPALLLLTLLINLFVLNIQTVNSYIIALYVSFLVSLVISSFQMIKIYKNTIQNSILFNSKSIIKNGFYNQLANVSHMLSNRYNFYLLGSNSLVGIYSISTSLIESVLIISSSAATIILTQVANRKDEVHHVRITFLLSKLCFLLSLGSIAVLLVIPNNFFTFLLGKDFELAKKVMLCLSPGILWISFSTIISHYFAGLGKQRLIAIANFAGLVTTLLTSYYLVNRYGIYGACYASCLSYFVASVVLIVTFMGGNKLSFLSLFKIKKDFEILKSIN